MHDVSGRNGWGEVQQSAQKKIGLTVLCATDLREIACHIYALPSHTRPPRQLLYNVLTRRRPGKAVDLELSLEALHPLQVYSCPWFPGC